MPTPRNLGDLLTAHNVEGYEPTYKVWIVVEKVDRNDDHIADLDLDFAATYETDDQAAAEAFANRLHNYGTGMEQS
jgi:hypothetical protein